MFNRNKNEAPGLDEAIALAFTELKKYTPESAQYAAAVAQIEKLYALKKVPKDSQQGLSANTVLPVAGNLLGIGMILFFEKADIITSKALGFVMKSK